MKRRVYLDHAGTTKPDPEVLKTYTALLADHYANSESLYDEGSEVHRMMEKARSAAAGLLGVSPSELIFTGGSCESNSMAVKGTLLACPTKKHIITTPIEHSSILNAVKQMERLFGCHVTWLRLNEHGAVDAQEVRNALRPDTALVSVMCVNNETGAVNPIEEIASIVKKESHAYFHSDLTQAIGKIPVSLVNVDLASISAHKLHGLKGSGILVKKTHVPMEPLISGGEQEYGLRGGTANAVADIVFAKTLRLALERQAQTAAHTAKLNQRLRQGLSEIEGIEFNSPDNAIPEVLNFSYEAIPSEVMQNELNRRGFMVSARSTCESNSNNPSYVLLAMGCSERRASCSIRVSLSLETTEAEIDAFIEAVKEMVQQYG
ncbi:MAG: cysteine desulfurase [Solobacterium sp.]|nr:cysteine desulfurase [Solobacterium sp.]